MLIEGNRIEDVCEIEAARPVSRSDQRLRLADGDRQAGLSSLSPPAQGVFASATQRIAAVSRVTFAWTFVMLAAFPVAATDLSKIGASGDGSYREVCAPGSYLVGLQVRSGLWIDQVAIKCARVAPNGSTGGVTISTAHGGDGGGLFSGKDSCDRGSIVIGLDFSFTPNNRQVRQFRMTCRPSAGGGTTTVAVGNTGDPITYRQECPPREVAIGIHGNSGRHVNAVGLICGGEPIPTRPTPAEAAKRQRCAGYAGLAVAQSKEWFERGCGPTTDRNRWSTNYRGHYGWCMSLPANDSSPEGESRARRGPLSQCRTINPLPGSGGSASGPACNYSAVIRNDVCLDSNGNPSTYWDSGSSSLPGCGSTADQAVANAKALFSISILPLAERPTPGMCTYTVERVTGCLCR